MILCLLSFVVVFRRGGGLEVRAGGRPAFVSSSPASSGVSGSLAALTEDAGRVWRSHFRPDSLGASRCRVCVSWGSLSLVIPGGGSDAGDPVPPPQGPHRQLGDLEARACTQCQDVPQDEASCSLRSSCQCAPRGCLPFPLTPRMPFPREAEPSPTPETGCTPATLNASSSHLNIGVVQRSCEDQ